MTGDPWIGVYANGRLTTSERRPSIASSVRWRPSTSCYPLTTSGSRSGFHEALLAQSGANGLLERLRRGEDGRGLVAAVGHAVVAARVAAPTVLLPLRGLDQLLVRLRIAVGHQVARALPAEDRIAGDAPRRALEIHLALEEVEEERGVVEAPLLALAVREGGAEQLMRLLDAQEVVLVRGLLVGVGRRDHHLVDLELVVDEIEDLSHRVRRVVREEGGVRGHSEPLLLG